MPHTSRWRLLRHPVERGLGPVFAKELRVASRRRRNYLLRFAYLAALMLFLAIMWLAADIASIADSDWRAQAITINGGSVHVRNLDIGALRTAQMAVAGQKITGGIVWFQFVAMQLLAMMLCAGGILAEARQRTLTTLLSTPITPRQVILGKLGASVHQLLLLLAISLPLLAMVRVLGGVDWMYLVASLCVTVTGTLLIGALSLRFSVTSGEPLGAIAKTLLWYAILFLAPVIWASPSFVMYQLYDNMRTAHAWDLGASASWVSHCIVSLIVTFFLVNWTARLLKNVSLEGSGQALKTSELAARPVIVAPPGAVPPLPSERGMAVPAMCSTGVSPVSERDAGILPACREDVSSSLLEDDKTRKQPRDCEDADKMSAGHEGKMPSSRAGARPAATPAKDGFGDDGLPLRRVTGSALVWKELRFFISGSRRRAVKIVSLIMLGMFLIYFGLAAQGSFSDFHHIYLWVYLGAGAIVMIALAPQCIAVEKQSQAMLALLTTPVSDWQIMLAKALGVFKRALAMWLLATGHCLVCWALGFMTGAQAAGIMLELLYLTIFLLGLGLYFSTKFHTPTWSLVSLIGTLSLAWIILPALPIHEMFRDPGPRMLVGELRDWLHESNPVLQAGGLLGYLGPPLTETPPQVLREMFMPAMLYIAVGAVLFWRAKARLRKDLF